MPKDEDYLTQTVKGFSGCLGWWLKRILFLILFPLLVYVIAETAAHLLGYRDK
jgi:hypothetical protein